MNGRCNLEMLNLTEYLWDLPVLVVGLAVYLWLRRRGVFSWPE